MKLDVKRYIEKETARLSEVVSQMDIIPKLVLINASNDTASETYINNKVKQCQKIGIESEVIRFDETVTNEELIKLISALNNDDAVTGVLIQVPLFEHLDEDLILNSLSSEKDVDGFNPINVGKLSLNQDTFVSCTPYGIMKMFEEYNIKLEGKNVTIIGRSNIVGKPLLQCCINKNATVTMCHSKTNNLEQYTKNADILIAAMGKAKFIKENMVKDGVVVIDVGINRGQDGKLTGDVDFENIEKKASYITPVPGGVGPMTIAMLMNNVIKAAKQFNI